MRAAGLVAGAGTLLAVAAGCGDFKRFENPDVVKGKQLFVAKCGACHVLARASTKGVVGPNLDAAFGSALSVGEGRSTIESVVRDQILNANPCCAMPTNTHDAAAVAGGARAFRFSSGEIDDIAAYVAGVAAKPGQDSGLLASAVQPAGTGRPVVEQRGKLELDANPNGLLAYTSSAATATHGAVTITMKNMSGVQHNIAVQPGTSGPVLGHTAIIANGTVSLTINLKPGTYTFFCQVDGHRAAGMTGTLTVK